MRSVDIVVNGNNPSKIQQELKSGKYLTSSNIFCALTIAICVVVAILSEIFSVTHHILIFDPWSIIYNANWYRFWSSPFSYRGIIDMIVGLCFFTYEFLLHTRNQNMIIITLDFLWRNFAINLFHMPIEIHVFPKYFDDSFVWGNNGLWSVTYTYIIKRLYQKLSTDKGSNFIYIHFVAYIIMDILVNWGVRLSMFAAILFGLVQAQIFDTFCPIIMNILTKKFRSQIQSKEEIQAEEDESKFL